ncbi:MAG: signal peptidase I [Agathobacter sp.]|nr:signal peptidase I [Agathobacter sp.]
MRLLRDIADVLTFMVLILGLLFALLFFGVRFVGITPYGVTSNSMAPMYPEGSVIYVGETVPEEIQKGEVLTFYMTEGGIASHQVCENDVENQFFRTQGINNHDEKGNILQDAEPVPYDKVIGKVLFGIPYLGWAHEELTTPPGLYYAIGSIALVIILNCAVSILEAVTNRKHEKQEEKERERKR